MPNLFADVPDQAPDELVDVLLAKEHVRINRIVSTGQASPPGFWYEQAEGEWVLLLQGSAGLLIEGEDEPRRLGPGDWLYLPPYERHRVEWTDPHEPTIWLAVWTTDASRLA